MRSAVIGEIVIVLNRSVALVAISPYRVRLIRAPLQVLGPDLWGLECHLALRTSPIPLNPLNAPAQKSVARFGSSDCCLPLRIALPDGVLHIVPPTPLVFKNRYGIGTDLLYFHSHSRYQKCRAGGAISCNMSCALKRDLSPNRPVIFPVAT